MDLNVWGEEYADAAKKICRWHHERDDGRGYPDGLKGDQIPIEALLVSIADVYDALTTKRVYKDAFEMDKAFNMVLDGECRAFFQLAQLAESWLPRTPCVGGLICDVELRL